VQRTPVELDKSNKDFKQFDSLLARPTRRAEVPGCNRYEVTATLVGRLDAVANAAIPYDKSGKIVGFGGFGHMNAIAPVWCWNRFRMLLRRRSTTRRRCCYEGRSGGGHRRHGFAAASRKWPRLCAGVPSGDSSTGVGAFGKENGAQWSGD